MLSVIMLNVVMLSVMGPKHFPCRKHSSLFVRRVPHGGKSFMKSTTGGMDTHSSGE
jgi:hypothetical protein